VDDAAGESSPAAWASADGSEWHQVDFPVASGPRFGGNFAADVSATDEGFVVVGVDDGRATTWTTSDGSRWDTSSLPDARVDAADITEADSIASTSDMLVVFGIIRSGNAVGPGWSSDSGVIPPQGRSQAAMWRSEDHGVSWTAITVPGLAQLNVQSIGPSAGDQHGFIGALVAFVGDRFAQAIVSSSDGIDWTLSLTPMTPRRAMTAGSNAWIAAGEADRMLELGPGFEEALQQPHSVDVWNAPFDP